MVAFPTQTNPSLSDDFLTGLEKDIHDLRAFAEPLQQEVTVTPLMPVIARIMSLNPMVTELTLAEQNLVRNEVLGCKRQLANLSYDYIQRIITKPNPSKVFRILNNANRFEKALRAANGRRIGQITITPTLIECLTRYRFSLGTPPITPEGIETVERIMFGGSLPDVYAFRDLLGCDRGVFDRFMGTVSQLVEQSTHYTTAAEKKEFERKATNFPETIGLRGLTKTVVTGTADTAIRLIRDHLLSEHENGSMPLKGVDEKYKLDDALIKAMTEDRNSIFVVRVDRVAHGAFTSDVLHEKWNGLIGRLVVIDESENALRSNNTIVYSLHARITDALAQFHVKDAGTPANTQMNLRLILQNFHATDIQQLGEKVDAKLALLEREGVHSMPIEVVRKKEWLLSSQKDYVCLKKFRSFLDFIIKMKTANPAELAQLNAELSTLSADLSKEYFFKELEWKGYECIPVPQGGGRREVGLAGKFHVEKHKKALDTFRDRELSPLRGRLAALRETVGIASESTSVEHSALERAMAQRRSPSAPIRGEVLSRGVRGLISRKVRARALELLHRSGDHSEKLIHAAVQRLDGILGVNLPGGLKVQVTRMLETVGIEAAAKMLERGRFRDAANRLRAFEGEFHRGLLTVADTALGGLEHVRQKLEPADLDLVEQMLNDIENGSFHPSLVRPELSWTVEDVLIEKDFPESNYVYITTQPDGQMDFGSLEAQLESKAKTLAQFPKLFDLYCRSLIIYFNDPHNPTSQIATPKAKLKLLDIASKYHIPILSDEPYHKQVAKRIKDKDGDAPLAVFYEQNRARFPNPVTICTALSTTKWAMGAGRRTGVLLTNDGFSCAGDTFKDFVGKNVDGFNTMSLRMDSETLSMGLLVKKVCKALEPATVFMDPIQAVDQVLAENFSQPGAVTFNLPVYSILIEARNDLDLLAIRGATHLDYRQYLSDVIKKLKKTLRLDKQTQKDSAKRSEAAVQAIHNLSGEFPGLERRCIKPQGPFYFCVQLDETARDSGLQPFLEALAMARKVDVVPLEKGYARFAFGGAMEGTPEGYKLLTLAIETDLRILMNYWKEFTEKRNALNDRGDLDPIGNALIALFPGGEADFTATMVEKTLLLEALGKADIRRRRRLTNRFSSTASKYLSSIEPDSPSTIVTIRAATCRETKNFVASTEFHELFEYALLQVKSKIPELNQMGNDEVIASYGAMQFAERFKTRDFQGVKKELFEEIVVQVANLWFSPSTIKILALEFAPSVDRATRADALRGVEPRVSGFLKDFIQAFVSKDREGEIQYRPAFQAGYDVVKAKGSADLQEWQKTVIGSGEFAGETVPTDRSPSMVTSGTIRVHGFERAILRRDGDGADAPSPDFFRKRFSEFSEVLNPKDYVFKMVQIGPTRLMLVMNRSYSHYLVEELRLFPQFDVSLADLKALKPDAISFMGIPTKVIGESYRIGYFMDQTVPQGVGQKPDMIPVSWVDAEDITDYMGYLKKPLLTMGNEKVKAMGGLPVHGSAFTIATKDGLRKTVVLAGDSGAGKSETIIAMIEQTVKGMGEAQNIEYVELLAGDMLSMWEGEDGQIYMLGTEQGDFMRLTDISEGYQNRFRDLLENASTTNLHHKTNPRATVPGLCIAEKALRPVRVNMFLTINNFEKAPNGIAFQEEEDPENLLCSIYPRGYRREKKTSEDQPNIYASVLFSDQSDRETLLRKYGEDFDKLLGWDLITKDGKIKNAILSFNDVPGEDFRANGMVIDLFRGKRITVGNHRDCEITKINYRRRENRFYAVVATPEGNETMPLDRTIFDQIYNPITSTYCGNPFVDPRGMDTILRRYGKAMKNAGVITGTLYTELARAGEQFSGPDRAAEAIINFVQTDDRINARFLRHKTIVSTALAEKYGARTFGSEALPQELEAHNLWLLERQQSDAIHLIDDTRETIPLKTPYFTNTQRSPDSAAIFQPALLTSKISECLGSILANPDAANVNVEDFSPSLADYTHIQCADSREELIYQILLANGVMRLNYSADVLQRHVPEVKYAEKTADMMISNGFIIGRQAAA